MEKPTIQELDLCLKDVVKNWKRFALHLPGMEYANVSIIELNNRDDVVEQKIAVYNKWLQVCPNASWDHVVKALETAEENTIAKQLREKYPATTRSIVAQPVEEQKQQIIPESDDSKEVTVPEVVVDKLDSLQQSFCSLTYDVKSEVEENGNIEGIVFHVQQAKAFPIDSLQSVTSTNELFKAIHPHYHFLNCHLIVHIALFLAGIIADKAIEYKKDVNEFMKTTKIRFLQKALKPYHQFTHRNIQAANNIMVEIRVENGWGDQNLWLVEMLVKMLFPVKHPDELPWYDIVPGSVVMTFIALEHMVSSLIESSRKQTEFMRLIGVISLKIGDELVWEKGSKNPFFFEDSLIQATLADNIEAVQFLLQYTQVNVNTMNADTTLISHTYTVNWLQNAELKKLLKSYYTSYTLLLKNIGLELPDLKKPDHHSRHENFFKSEILLHLSNHDECLSKLLSLKIKQYRQSIEDLLKKRVEVATFAESLKQYFPTQFTDSIEVILTLHSVWRVRSVWYVEQLGQLIFTPTLFHKLQWFRVYNPTEDASEESFRVIFSADMELINDLVERCFNCNESSLLGVISVRVDDIVVISNDYSIGYTFNEAIELAKANGNDELSEFFLQINQKPMKWEGVSVDKNKNISFIPESDSTSLMIACCTNNNQLVQLLLNLNADPNVQTARGITALMYSTGDFEIFQMLIDHGADVNKLTLFNESLLHFACIAGNVKVIKSLLLMQFVELIDAKDSSNGSTPLMLACSNGHTAVVEVLLEAGADPDLQDFEGNTALMRGTYPGRYPAIVDVLLRAKADLEIQNNEEYTALYLAIDEADKDSFGMIIDDDSEQIIDQFVHSDASLNMHPQFLCKILRGVPDENKDDAINKLVVEASESDELDVTFCVCCKSGVVSIVKVLLEKTKANPNNTLLEGRTPLMHAIEDQHIYMVEVLLYQAQADPNIQVAETGETALMMACRNYCDVEVINLLLQAGANPTLMDNHGDTALDIVYDNEIVGLLRRNINNTTNVYILMFIVAVCFSYIKAFA